MIVTIDFPYMSDLLRIGIDQVLFLTGVIWLLSLLQPSQGKISMSAHPGGVGRLARSLKCPEGWDRVQICYRSEPYRSMSHQPPPGLIINYTGSFSIFMQKGRNGLPPLPVLFLASRPVVIEENGKYTQISPQRIPEHFDSEILSRAEAKSGSWGNCEA
jgi:hypothetical protein